MSIAISRQLAEFTHALSYDALPADVRELAGLCLLDWMGSAYRGSIEKPAAIFNAVAARSPGAGAATALPSRRKTSVYWAAQINAAASHTVEMDDLHPSSVLHPAAPIIPAALAVAEATGASGRTLIEAIVAGYEIGIRAGDAAGPTHYNYWHTTATCGTFGAAAAAGKVLGLSVAELESALGSAGTQAAGLWQFLDDGAMSKQLHTAHAAASGILAAELAREGFTAAREIFEGRKGFLSAMSREPGVHFLTGGLGESYRITSNAFKKHASCRHTHSAIDAAIEIRAMGVHAEQIQSVRVYVYPAAFDLLNGVEASTAYAAKFSMPFTVAAALARGRVSLPEFEDLSAADIRSLMNRIEMQAEPALGKDYPVKWPARIDARLTDGRTVSAAVDYPKGDSLNPMSARELEDKFRGLTEGILRSAESLDVIDRVRRVGEITAAEVWPQPSGS